jgi:prepilin-type N-terminal cleavage/methylation domain-containing protein
MQKRGFTLIEVLTVILIIGILTTITTYTYNSSLARSRDSQRLTDLKAIQNTLEQYYLDKRSYPNYQYPAAQDTPGGYPWVAKFELERFPNGTWPGCTQNDNPKTYIAPKYISSLPEDPLHKLQLDDSCRIIPTAGVRGAYQYMYVPFMAVDDVSLPITRGYYLMAKMERKNNVIASLAPVKSAINGTDFAFTRTVLDLPGGNLEFGSGGRPWPGLPYNYCSQAMTGNPVGTNCHINYFLSNKDR